MGINRTLVIRIAGDSGDGVQIIGEQLTITAAQSGRDVRTLPDFPAEIRAPGGTVAGVSGFQLAIAEVPLYTAGEKIDVLVALNPAALVQAVPKLKTGGLLLLNVTDSFEKDCIKAGLDLQQLEIWKTQFQVLSLPLLQQAIASVSTSGLRHAQAKKTKNFYALGIILWLCDFSLEACLGFIHKKFKNDLALQEGNRAALQAGYYYAETLELSRQNFQLDHVTRAQGDWRQITGVEAVSLALATLATRFQQAVFVAGYPITPASAILHACANLASFGVALFQAEDEIAAIGACLGAAFGGTPAITVTSGPGFDLKAEFLGLAVATELPLVVLNVQRAGVSTGLPTKTGQSDLNAALFGRHGEAPVPVLAAQSPADCFDTIIEAFTIAIRYMTPVVVLLDAYLANAAEPWQIPDPELIRVAEIRYNRAIEPFARDAYLARSWNKPGSPGYIHQLGGLEKQGVWGKVSYDAANHAEMVHTRAQKIANIMQEYAPIRVGGISDSRIVIIGWGSTFGAIQQCIVHCHEQGLDLAHLHLRHLNPLPDDIEAILQPYARIFVVELNAGQLHAHLRTKYLLPCDLISQCDGQPLSAHFLENAIRRQVEHENLLSS